ncbi:MAG: hypothetical protein ACLFVU_06485 [Phycisphaerae bacterium]
MSDSHHPIFDRLGRSYHLRIADASDLQTALHLDNAHWVSTSAPINSLNLDRTFLELIDADGDGRILCDDVRACIRWLLDTLSDYSGIDCRSDVLRFDSVAGDSTDGRLILDASRRILRQMAPGDADSSVSLSQVRQVRREIESKPVSEMGVVLPDAADDEEIRQFLLDVRGSVGGAPHPSGENGVSENILQIFLNETRAYLEWIARGDIPEGQQSTEIMVLGEETPEAFQQVSWLREKIDRYFAQCQAVDFRGDLAARMGPSEDELRNTDYDSPESIRNLMAESPIAIPRADRVLVYQENINPYYAQPIRRLMSEVAEKLLGELSGQITQSQWEALCQEVAAFGSWKSAKSGAAVESLGREKLSHYLDERFATATRELISHRQETALELDSVRLVEKLILLQANMIRLTNNFVSFPELYSHHLRASFELGTLIMDGRRFNLAVRVNDLAEHSAVARNSNMYVLYAEVSRPVKQDKITIASPVTYGGKWNLAVGKRGVFERLDGEILDARIVQIIENPISLREAFWAPFRRIGKLITGKIESITAEAEKKLDLQTGQAVTTVQGAAEQKPEPKTSAGFLVGGGVAIAALGSAVAYITKTFSQTPWPAILIGVLAAVLAVILPTSIIAFLKLRQRDLSSILEGTGWAINARMRLSRRQSKHFSQKPAYPAGSRGIRDLRWLLGVGVILVVLSLGGWLGYRAYRKYIAPEPAATATQPSTQPASAETQPE